MLQILKEKKTFVLMSALFIVVIGFIVYQWIAIRRLNKKVDEIDKSVRDCKNSVTTNCITKAPNSQSLLKKRTKKSISSASPPPAPQKPIKSETTPPSKPVPTPFVPSQLLNPFMDIPLTSFIISNQLDIPLANTSVTPPKVEIVDDNDDDDDEQSINLDSLQDKSDTESNVSKDDIMDEEELDKQLEQEFEELNESK